MTIFHQTSLRFQHVTMTKNTDFNDHDGKSWSKTRDRLTSINELQLISVAVISDKHIHKVTKSKKTKIKIRDPGL